MPVEFHGVHEGPITKARDGTQSDLEWSVTGQSRKDGEPQPHDRISLTDQTSRLKELASTISSMPDIDTERAQSVQKALASNTYYIDPNRIAQRLIDFESSLL